MSMHIYIPTYRRVDAQITLTRMPREWRERTTLVCVRDEEKPLRDRYRDVNILVQPSEVKTIAAKRQWIVDQCPHDKLVMIDDDIRLCVRRLGMQSGKYPEGDVSLLQADKFSQALLFQELETQLDKYAHAGVSMRMGNQSRAPGWHENKRMCYLLAYRTETLRRFARFDTIAHREDMYVTLRLLTAGFANTVSHLWAADQIYNKAGGENAAGRSMDASNKDAYRLAEMFPQFVRAEKKAYKNSVQRVEVVVRWTKAFNENLS
jgi:hypothetical protein